MIRQLIVVLGILSAVFLVTGRAGESGQAEVSLVTTGELATNAQSALAVAEREGRWLKDFQTINTLAAPAQKTAACLMSDGAALYLIVKADEPDPQLVANETEQDGKVWRDDSIELFIRANRDESCYLQIQANTIGTTNDGAYAQSGFVRNGAWSSHATASTVKTATGWGMVIRIPLASLQVESSLNQWAIQIARNRQARKGEAVDISTWPAAPQGLQNPSTFSALQIPEALDLNRFGWVLTPGAATITHEEGEYFLTQELQVTNQTGRYRTLQVTSTVTAGAASPAPASALSGSIGFGLAGGKGQGVVARIPLGKMPRVSGAVEHRISLISAADEVLAFNAGEVDLNYTPARLVLDVPGYRAAIFASQNSTTIEARLLRLDRSLALEGVKATLVGAEGKTWEAKVSALPKEGKEGKEGNQGDGWRVKVEGVEALPEGEYELKVTFTTPNETNGSSELVRTIRKLPHRKGEVWIDRRGMVHRDGKPQPIYGFLFGHWHQYSKDRILPGMFLNFVSPQRVKPPFAELNARLDRMDQHGVLMAVDVPTASKTGFTKDKGNTPLTATERDEYREIIRAVGDDPRVMAWYLFDEPEIHGIGPERMKEVYEIFRKHDPWRPVIILNAYTDSTRSYQYGADISNPDPYPLFLEGRGASRTLDYIGRFLDEITTGEESYRARWVTPQAFNYFYFGRSGNRGPTAREMRTQQVISLIHGATGVTWYPEYLIWNEPGVTASLSYLSREYKALFPLIVEAAPEVLKSEERLEAGLIQSGGHSVLLLANPFWEKKSFSLKDSRFAAMPTWVKLGSSEEVRTDGQSVTITLEPHESMILSSPGFEWPDELNWAAVEKDEERLRSEMIVPGNIAHISRGTEVRLVEDSGRSPSPFIIDGVKDPRSTVWSGPPFKKGLTLEIEFKEAARPAQLQIFGSNLVDATVEIEKEGGWVEKARIKNATPEELRKINWEPEETRKVRLVVHSIVKGNRTLGIREVEIYE